MKTNPTVLIKDIETKSIVWFLSSNSYLVFEQIMGQLIKKINAGIAKAKIEDWCASTLNIPLKTAANFVADVLQLINSHNFQIQKNTEPKNVHFIKSLQVPKAFYSTKIYQIYNTCISIDYESEYLESLIHLKFAHLETDTNQEQTIFYQVFTHQNEVVFYKNDHYIDSWTKNNIHFFQGKLSMHIIMDIYHKPEADWLGVFHASALSNQKETILFLGDSGNGKSTSLALLNANGFECIADDFVPVNLLQQVHPFPAAISIKKNSVQTLLPFYPELKNTSEVYLESMQKKVRYLAPKNTNYSKQFPCKALIFIKYQKNTELKLHKLSKIEAFQQLIPDSWISPLATNATVFLDWFAKLPCYELHYSNNQKMIETVTKIFDDEL